MSADEQAPAKDEQVVFLIGRSRNHEHDDKKVVAKARAAELVKNGLARYPDNYKG